MHFQIRDMDLSHVSISVHCLCYFCYFLCWWSPKASSHVGWEKGQMCPFKVRREGCVCVCVCVCAGGSLLPGFRAEQVGMPEQQCFVWVTMDKRPFKVSWFLYNVIFPVSPHFLFTFHLQKTFKNLWISQLLLKFIDWIFNTLSLIQMWKNLKQWACTISV